MNPDPLPSIDQNLCTGCRRCVDICPTHALDQAHEKAYLRYPDLCTYCTACEDVCPVNAIALPFLILLAPAHHLPADDPHYLLTINSQQSTVNNQLGTAAP
ncbi:MAG: ferredoxin family protein [Caldilineales bacterium]|nr:ferredoxin family protein [Caldilineales bacterium]MCW5860326.1 ferredoxin family protein [Caldilineales bacterium]